MLDIAVKIYFPNFLNNNVNNFDTVDSYNNA